MTGLTWPVTNALSREERAGSLVAVVVPVEGQIHAVSGQEILQRFSQLCRNRLVGVLGPLVRAIDVHGPVPVDYHPGGPPSIHPSQVAGDERALLRACRDGPLIRDIVENAIACVTFQACV